jgi:hypothetical protein
VAILSHHLEAHFVLASFQSERGDGRAATVFGWR